MVKFWRYLALLVVTGVGIPSIAEASATTTAPSETAVAESTVQTAATAPVTLATTTTQEQEESWWWLACVACILLAIGLAVVAPWEIAALLADPTKGPMIIAACGTACAKWIEA
jgi:galactitol-specific phosphotransferase system IIC component